MPFSLLLQEPDSPQNKLRTNFAGPLGEDSVSSATLAAWHGQGALVGRKRVRGSGCCTPRGVPAFACATTLHEATGISAPQRGCARVTMATV